MPSGHIWRESPVPKLQVVLTLYVEGWTWLETFNLYLQHFYPFLVNVSSTNRGYFAGEPRINCDHTNGMSMCQQAEGTSFTPWPALPQNDADITNGVLQEDLEHSDTNIWEKCSLLKQKIGRTVFLTRRVCMYVYVFETQTSLLWKI